MHADVAVILTVNTRQSKEQEALDAVYSQVADIMLPLVDDVIDYYNADDDSRAGYLRTIDGKKVQCCRISDFDWFADNLPYWVINHGVLDELEVQDCYDHVQNIITEAKNDEVLFAKRKDRNEVWIYNVDVHI